jgi:hypothetical protein
MAQQLLTNCGLDCYGGSAGYPDDQLVQTTRGMIRADSVNGATPASLAVPGADADGLVTYSAAGGRWGNEITVEHLEGATGAGNESRALEVVLVGKAVTVTFGTDGGGASSAPTAGEVVAALGAVTELVSAVAGGTGASAAGLAAAANLAGGENDGDHLCVGPAGRFSVQVNTRKAI